MSRKLKSSVKTLYIAEWGEVHEIVRYRGVRGHYVSVAYARRWLGKRRISEEIEQWLIIDGKRSQKIMRSTPSMLMKTTYPGSVADNEGNIYASLENTNLFTQVSRANRALINIRGLDGSGNLVRLQGEITFGDSNQDEQLTMAVKQLMANEGYRTNYSLQIVRSPKVRRASAKLEPLTETQFTVTLLR